MQVVVHNLLGGMLDCRPPSMEKQWRCQAEIRFIAAQAIAANLPHDTPPEIVELARMDDKGNPLEYETYRRAVSAEISASENQ